MESQSTSSPTNLKAIRDKRFPPCITVTGQVMIYTMDGKATIREADSPSINETILSLELEVKEGSGPMKGVYKEIEPYEYCNDAQKYKQVNVRYNGKENYITIEG